MTCSRPARRQRRDGFGPEGKPAFLEAIEAGSNVERAAQAAGFSVPTIYRYLNRCPDFDAAYAEAKRSRREARAAG